jgi:hypothetical protein
MPQNEIIQKQLQVKEKMVKFVKQLGLKSKKFL